MKHAPVLDDGNGHDPDPKPNAQTPVAANGGGITGLIAEAEAIKSLLHDACSRSNQLLVAIKRYKKQAQVVQATLSSLRQLQQVDG